MGSRRQVGAGENDETSLPSSASPTLLRPCQGGQEGNELSYRGSSRGKPRTSETVGERCPCTGRERTRSGRQDSPDLRSLLWGPSHRPGAGFGRGTRRLPGQLWLESASLGCRHWAAYRGHMESVQELVTGGADARLTTNMDRNTKKEYTAWDLASMYGHREV